MKKYRLLEDIMVNFNIIPEGSYLVETPIVAPAKPATRPGTKPPNTPAPNRPSPFTPPQPKVFPRPKAKKKLVEAYEDEAHASVRGHWDTIHKRDNTHILSKHPIFAMHGKNLAKAGYEEYGDIPRNFNFQGAVYKIMQLESKHKEQLEELAKDIICKIWGIDRDKLKPELTQDCEIPEAGELQTIDVDDVDDVIDDQMRKHINKRITFNTISHGSAVHIMKTAHHLIDDAIKKISPELLKLYTDVARYAHKMYWLFLFTKTMMSSPVGEAAVVWKDGEPVVVAKAVIFPVLVQELSKGVSELISLHDYSAHDENTQRIVSKYADDVMNEQWMIQIGVNLWQKFLKVIPNDIPLAELLMKFALMDPDKVHEIVNTVIEDPEMAKQTLADAVKEPEAPTEEEGDTTLEPLF